MMKHVDLLAAFVPFCTHTLVQFVQSDPSFILLKIPEYLEC